MEHLCNNFFFCFYYCLNSNEIDKSINNLATSIADKNIKNLH